MNIPFVNADVIAQGLSGGDPDSVALEAGQIMLRRLHTLAERRVSFAFETTMASKSFAPWIRTMRGDFGYKFYLYFLWLKDAEQAVGRVAERVRTGGHHVPADTIRRRYAAGLRNFFKLYQPLADQWEMIDNSVVGVARIIASGTLATVSGVQNEEAWTSIFREYAL